MTEHVRVALLADFVEEGWPSMDLVADMLATEMRDYDDFEVELIRPMMRRRLSAGSRRPASMVDRALNRFVDYPRLMRKRKSDFTLFHVLDHSYSQLVHELPTGRSVVTCHDLDTFRCLWEPKEAQRGFAFRAMTRRILAGLQKAAHVCCDSQSTRDELVGREILPGNKTTVIPLGVNPAMTGAPDSAMETRVTALLGISDKMAPYILHVGSTIARKRMDVLLDVFARLRQRRPDLRLVRVGGGFTGAQESQVERLGLAKVIDVLPFLSAAELAAVYRRATLVVLPSAAEGFGLPVVEAMANGTPVVASDLPVLREVGGDAGEYAQVGHIEEWCAKCEALFAEQEMTERGAKRRERCRQQAAKFSWKETARLTAQVYRHVLADGRMA